MIDMQKLLVGMASEAMRGSLRPQRRSAGRSSRRTFGMSEGKIVMGLLGIAVAAFEYYTRAGRSASSSGPRSSSVPPPPPSPSSGPADVDPGMLVLLRAMVAAAHADGTLDQQERSSIIQQLGTAQLSSEERSFLEQELSRPHAIAEIAATARGTDLSPRAYSAALLAVTVDTDAEREFLNELAGELQLSQEKRSSIHQALGVPEFWKN